MEDLGAMITMKLRVVFCLAAATIVAACGGTGDNADDQVGTVEQELAPPGSNSVYVPGSSNFPTQWAPGERRLITLAMQNTGTSGSPTNDWLTSGPAYQLATLDSAWSWSYTPIASRTNVGSTAFISQILTAPASTTTFRARMRAGFTDQFGATINLAPTISSSFLRFWTRQSCRPAFRPR